MDVIFQNIKTLVEVDIDDVIFDNQLLLLINKSISYLINNNIPISAITINSQRSEWVNIKSIDIPIIEEFIYLDVISKFDSITNNTTYKFIEDTKDDNLYQLKARYYVNEKQ